MSAETVTTPRSTHSGGIDFGHREITIRRAKIAVRLSWRSVVVTATMTILAVAVMIVALMLGDYPLTFGQVIGAVTGDPDAGFARTVVVEWRMPRAFAAVMFGAALGVSGAVFQSMTRNPLASPDIIGFATGAYTGALVIIIIVGGSYLQMASGALLGGMLTALAVYLLAWRKGVQGFRLIIVGIAVSSVLGSFNTWLMLTADLEVAMSAAAWGAGSLNGISWEQAAIGSAVIAILLLALIPVAAGLRQLELGDDAAKATGTRTEGVRLSAMVIGVALTAAVTAAAGPIAFVSLAGPQIARRIARTAGVTMATSAATGAFLLVAADVLAQHLLPVALPVGVVTVVGGGGYLVWLIIAEVRRRG